MRVLIVEDEEVLAKSIASKVTAAGMVPTLIDNGLHADSLLEQEAQASRHFDAVVLDLTLPGRDGLDVLKNLRKRRDGTPVLVLTARSTLADRVNGLELGADDYLAKPFEPEELVARLRTIARRRGPSADLSTELGNVTYDKARGEFTVEGALLVLPPKSRAILEALFRRRGSQVTKEFLTNMDSDGASADSVDTQISRIRKRLREAGATVRIRTLHGTGYTLEAEDA